MIYCGTLISRYNEPLYNEVLSVTNDFLHPSNSKTYGKVPRYNKPHYSKQILPVRWYFIISRFHCNTKNLQTVFNTQKIPTLIKPPKFSDLKTLQNQKFQTPKNPSIISVT